MKKFLITGIACTLVAFFLSVFVHGVLLASYYSELVERGVVRSPDEAASYIHFLILAHVLIGFAFAWIYLRGVESDRAWYLQGVRFALAIICLTTIPGYLIYYVIQPLPGVLVIQQIVYDSIMVIILGLIAAFINRDRSATEIK